MAYNEETTERVRKELAHVPNVEEKKMYGGIVFMVNGKMCVTVGGNDADIVMVRVGKEAYLDALKRKGAMPTIMNGREIKGYIDLGSEGQKDLKSWVELALAFNRELAGSKA